MEIDFTIIQKNTIVDWTNILHFTDGQNCCKMGNRIPGKT